MRRWPFASLLLVLSGAACGLVEEVPASEAQDAGADAADATTPSYDAAEPATDAGAPFREAGTCPARRPWGFEACEPADEGRSCVYGAACKAECICERGSFVCASDTCASTCPAKAPEEQSCTADEVDRVCVYSGYFCAPTCRCAPSDGGFAWQCLRPPC